MFWSGSTAPSKEQMILRAMLDRSTVPVKRFFANLVAPSPSTLGYPLFSERIRDRKRRWLGERQPNPYAAVAAKTDGLAYMRSLGHPVPDLYGVYPSVDAIPDFSELPSAFVLKPANSWSAKGVFLMRNGFDLKRRRSFTRQEIIEKVRFFDRATGRTIAKDTWVVEELLFDFTDNSLPARDHKFLCFGPKVAMIQINQRTGLKKPDILVWFRDADWKPLPFRIN